MKVEMDSETAESPEKSDMFSKLFFYVIPWTIPVIVTFLTYLFYSLVAHLNMVWLPLLFIYWATIWGYTLLYRKVRGGGIFNRERFKLTLRLKGKKLWLQYVFVYGPFIYAIPMFIFFYALNPRISVAMYVAIFFASIINGPSEEIFWRGCMDEVGKNIGASERKRLIYTPIVFAFWHTAFVIHLIPWGVNWWIFWAFVMLITWSSGTVFLWVMHRSERLVPQAFYHACANFLNIFPMLLITVIGFYF